MKVFAGSDFKSLRREIDVVSSLPHHDNIVKLFGVEEEVRRTDFNTRLIRSKLVIRQEKKWENN